jgi:hypothetical protein
LAAVTLALLLLAPASALACPVCGLAGSAESNTAYVAMTVMLSALPLGMIAGVAIWIRRRVTADEARQAAEPRSPRE